MKPMPKWIEYEKIPDVETIYGIKDGYSVKKRKEYKFLVIHRSNSYHDWAITDISTGKIKVSHFKTRRDAANYILNLRYKNHERKTTSNSDIAASN